MLSEISAGSLHSHIYTEHLPKDLVNIEDLFMFATAILAQHANQHGHSPDTDHVIIVDKAADYHKRLFLEAWHSKRDQNTGNEHIEITDLYISIEYYSLTVCDSVY